jgi:hypothetical protein
MRRTRRWSTDRSAGRETAGASARAGHFDAGAYVGELGQAWASPEAALDGRETTDTPGEMGGRAPVVSREPERKAVT